MEEGYRYAKFQPNCFTSYGNIIIDSLLIMLANVAIGHNAVYVKLECPFIIQMQ